MSGFIGHSRHLTWPPNLHLLPRQSTGSKTHTPGSALSPHTTYTRPLPQDDEDPFSHFLSPVLEEDDPYDDSSYSAGITPYISNSTSQKDALFRARLEERWETYVARRLLKHSSKASSASIPAPLPPPFPQTSATPPEEESIPDLLADLEEEGMDAEMATTPDGTIGLPIPHSSSSSSLSRMDWHFPSTVSSYDDDDDRFIHADTDESEDDMDGWEADRRHSRAAINGKDGQLVSPRRKFKPVSPQLSRPRPSPLRTLSGKRHAWREPSEELWTVEEEVEQPHGENNLDQDDVFEDRGRRRSNGSERGRKRVKMVHWDEEVHVMEFER